MIANELMTRTADVIRQVGGGVCAKSRDRMKFRPLEVKLRNILSRMRKR